MTDPIRPALTPEQWATAFRRTAEYEGAGWHAPPYFFAELAQWECGERMERESTHHGSRHALAALALHQMPFGFTLEDVAMLREATRDCHADYADRCESIAARIAALLPPEAS